MSTTREPAEDRKAEAEEKQKVDEPACPWIGRGRAVRKRCSNQEEDHQHYKDDFDHFFDSFLN